MPRLKSLDPESHLAQILVSFVGCIGLTSLMLLPVLVYAYDQQLGYGPDVAGWMSSSALAGLALATVLVSFRTQHWPMDKVATVGMVIMLVPLVLALFLHGQAEFFVLTFFVGFGGGLTQAAVAAALSRVKHTEKAFAIFTFFQFVYPGVAAYFLPRLMEGGGFSTFLSGFNAMEAVIIVLTVLALLLSPVTGAFRLPDHGEDGQPELEISLILRGGAALSVVGIMIYGASNAAVWAYSEGIGRNAGLDIYQVSDIIAYANIFAGFSALGVIWLGDRIGHFIPLIGGLIGQLLSMYLLVAHASFNGYVAGIFVFTVAWAIVWPYFLSIQSDLDDTGTVVTFGQFTNLFGTALGPTLAANFVGAEGDFAAAIWVSSAMTALAIVPMVMIPFVDRAIRKQES